MRHTLVALLALVGTGCGSCRGGPPAELRVGGAHPYVRCMDLPAPDEESRRAGSTTVTFRGRELQLGNVPDPMDIAVFTGPGASPADPGPEIESLRDADLDALVVLGDIGDSVPRAARTLRAAAGLGLPVLVVAGGRDDAVVLDEALEEVDDPRLLDLRPIRRVVAGHAVLIPISGAPEGRYARTDTACGFAPEDLDQVARQLGSGGSERRFLLSWAAPAGTGPGHLGADPGDPGLADLAEQVGAPGGVFGWPGAVWPEPSSAGTASRERRIVVGSVAGPMVEAADGTLRPTGPTLVRLSGDGLAVRERGREGDEAPPSAP